jgi:hypothetical protein
MRRRVIGLVACACLLQVHVATAQGLTGALIGSVRDAQGEVVSGAVVRLSSPALIGGAQTLTTNETGQLRFPALPPGLVTALFNPQRLDGIDGRRPQRRNVAGEEGGPNQRQGDRRVGHGIDRVHLEQQR